MLLPHMMCTHSQHTTLACTFRILTASIPMFHQSVQAESSNMNVHVMAASLSAACVDQHGTRIHFCWKSWNTADDSLRWEIRRYIPTLGYKLNDGISELIRSHLPRWAPLFAKFGANQQCWGLSFKSQSCIDAKQGQRTEQSCEPEAWLSTSGLIILSLFYIDF